MKISAMMPSSYLKKEDVPTPALVTISRFTHENLAQDGQPKDEKWVMHFNEFDRGLVMNPTNLQLAALALGSDDTDDWLGRQIVLYTDPNVSFGGKLVGGLRLRARKQSRPAAAPAAPPPPPPPRAPVASFDDMDDDIPF